MPSLLSFLSPVLLLFDLLYIATPCCAQTGQTFQWQFANSVSQSLPTCKPLSVVVKPFNSSSNSTGVPPYYMTAFEIGGTPSTTLIGRNLSSLSWTVDHAAGAQLMLDVVDSLGNPGGIPPQLFTVVTGQSTSCIPPKSQSGFTVSANVTDTVTTCQPWGLRIKGGVLPYSVTLVALNSPFVTNVTLGPQDDAFTYIDRADPNTQLLAAISDFNGNWASGTPVVKTQGSSDVSCVGLVSSGGNSTQLQELADETAAAKKKKKRVAVGVSVTFVLLALIGGVAAFLFLRMRKIKREIESGPDTSCKPFQLEDATSDGQMLSINTFFSPSSSSSSPGSDTVADYTITSSRNSIRGNNDTQTWTNNASSGRPGFTNFPNRPGRRSAKAFEAGYSLGPSGSPAPDSSNSFSRAQSARSALTASGSPTGGVPNRSLSLDTATLETQPGGITEVVYQHRDGGTIVRELPPPYADRSDPGRTRD